MFTIEADRWMFAGFSRRPKPHHRLGATAKRERRLRAKKRIEERIVELKAGMEDGGLCDADTKQMTRSLFISEVELKNITRNLSQVQRNKFVVSLGPSDEVHG